MPYLKIKTNAIILPTLFSRTQFTTTKTATTIAKPPPAQAQAQETGGGLNTVVVKKKKKRPLRATIPGRPQASRPTRIHDIDSYVELYTTPNQFRRSRLVDVFVNKNNYSVYDSSSSTNNTRPRSVIHRH